MIRMIRMTNTVKSVAAAAALMLTLCGAALAGPDQGTAAVQVDPGGKESVEGRLEFKELEGGYYSVGGWALLGDPDLYSTLAGQQLLVQGKPFTGVTTWQVPTLDVSGIYRSLDATMALPAAIQVDGKEVRFDQGPVSRNGKTLIPLRFVAEAAGAKVTWDGETRTATVEMADRTALFSVGQAEAEMNKRGVFYIRRNLLPLSQAPVIIKGRMLVPADALTQILGLYQVVEKDSSALKLAVPER